MVNHFEIHIFFQDIDSQLQEDIIHYFLHYSFTKSSSNWEVSSIQSKLFTGSFRDIVHPYKLFRSQY